MLLTGLALYFGNFWFALGFFGHALIFAVLAKKNKELIKTKRKEKKVLISEGS